MGPVNSCIYVASFLQSTISEKDEMDLTKLSQEEKNWLDFGDLELWIF